ncbi:soma ferritin-like [Apostichopus japonicus]|uniref:soma ferritin-like n=1 Tax=Stichopus japonicus TaxID=307972 RepID=UPI003AB80FD0
MATNSNVKQNFHAETETFINTLIQLELTSSYGYLAMSTHYDRDDVALSGFHKFLKDMSEKKKENADKLMQKQNKRGGRVTFQDVQASSRSNWGKGSEGLAAAMEAEINSNQTFLKFHNLAETHEDKHTMDWIEEEFLTPYVENIKRLGDLKQQLSRAGDGLGEYIFDKELAE